MMRRIHLKQLVKLLILQVILSNKKNSKPNNMILEVKIIKEIHMASQSILKIKEFSITFTDLITDIIFESL
jgi:hypothetical protein